MAYTNIIFPAAISSAFKPAFNDAAAFWNNVISSGTGGFSIPSPGLDANDFCGVDFQYRTGDIINGVDIFSVVEPIDGPGSILGAAGPCAVLGNFPILGIMRFDSADAQGLLDGGSFGEVIVHEMGHVLGLGTLWTPLLNNPCAMNNLPCNTRPTYTGSNGLQGYADLGGVGDLLVADTGGPGTRNGHWKESFFVNELMTGFLNSGTANPLSVLTVKSLRDLGYGVNLAASEPYNIPSEFQRPLNTVDVELVGDIIAFDPVDLNDFFANAQEEVEPTVSGEEIDIESEYQSQVTALFVVMILGFLMMGALMMSFAQKQKKMLLAFRQSSPTENPAFLQQ